VLELEGEEVQLTKLDSALKAKLDELAGLVLGHGSVTIARILNIAATRIHWVLPGLDKKADLVEEEQGLELQAEHQVCDEDIWPLCPVVTLQLSLPSLR
jgi:hypothetical protein